MASEYAGAGEWYNGENSGLTDDDDDEGLFRAANNIGDEFGNWDEDSNPGDQVLWYGQYKGHKYDQLPPSYVEWTIEKYLKSPDTASPNVCSHLRIYKSGLTNSHLDQGLQGVARSKASLDRKKCFQASASRKGNHMVRPAYRHCFRQIGLCICDESL